jgi:hypothetical protein
LQPARQVNTVVRQTNMHPARKLLDWLPELDFALLRHGFQAHGRDYLWHIQDCLGTDPGEHEIVFTHCVQADCQTRVRDDVWLEAVSEPWRHFFSIEVEAQRGQRFASLRFGLQKGLDPHKGSFETASKVMD